STVHRLNRLPTLARTSSDTNEQSTASYSTTAPIFASVSMKMLLVAQDAAKFSSNTGTTSKIVSCSEIGTGLTNLLLSTICSGNWSRTSASKEQVSTPGDPATG